MVKHFKFYSLERKAMRPAGYKDRTTQETFEKLCQDPDDPITKKIVANTVDMNARHIKRMVNDEAGAVAYRMLDADNEASSEELGSDSEEDVDELADDVANLTMDQSVMGRSMYRQSGFTMRHAGGSWIIKNSMKGGAGS